MTLTGYLKDYTLSFVFQILCMTAASLFLYLTGNTMDTIVFFLSVWGLLLFFYTVCSFRHRKRNLNHLLSMTRDLKERYLIAELMEPPQRCDDYVYYKILKMAAKSMLEEIGDANRKSQDYKEYIEQWIHEIKTPISAMKLLCDNHKTDFTRTMLVELERLNHYAETALYYSRSEAVEKDFLIRQTPLEEIIHNSIAGEKQLLISNRVALSLDDCNYFVCTDGKWVTFILNQLIHNSVQYKSAEPAIHFKASEAGRDILLHITDNGIGVPPEDLPRIFEKGFTGTNGRKGNSSTGIGLYLCRKLCKKLDIGISASSIPNKGLTITLTFSKAPGLS